MALALTQMMNRVIEFTTLNRCIKAKDSVTKTLNVTTSVKYSYKTRIDWLQTTHKSMCYGTTKPSNNYAGNKQRESHKASKQNILERWNRWSSGEKSKKVLGDKSYTCFLFIYSSRNERPRTAHRLNPNLDANSDGSSWFAPSLARPDIFITLLQTLP